MPEGTRFDFTTPAYSNPKQYVPCKECSASIRNIISHLQRGPGDTHYQETRDAVLQLAIIIRQTEAQDD